MRRRDKHHAFRDSKIHPVDEEVLGILGSYSLVDRLFVGLMQDADLRSHFNQKNEVQIV
jgi:hypothetical protein